MKLLLFDIDGTLIKPIQSSRIHIEYVLGELCGRSISTQGVSFSGRTDPQIFEETLHLAGFSPEETEDLIPIALKRYTAHATYVSDEVESSDGVVELLEYLKPNKSVQLALLTGNVRVTAYRKLAAARLDDLFPFGAFGCDHADRNKLPAIAASRALKHCGRTFVKDDIVIIGDSVHDITCGQGIGALSVAVATGYTSYQDLKSAEPDVLLQDLTNIDDFCHQAGIKSDAC
ncbi:MAG: HAD hydrolase-like protein [Rhodothermaceae bacterium]|nr:HAD hydrolase-like protein [Bacteroidota bacterium]MXZ16904.1 HAD hydrolase-like protein [Rhodothermaceae bacterium]MYG69443.1 HAD hydrolase-like protein [Rhodothermaceae bacterium]MYJ44523.1 HAD hydrolase-like protein [Rhodothermaceae bacterium]